MKSKGSERKNYLLIAAILFSIIAYTIFSSRISFNLRPLAEDADPNFCQNYCAGRKRCDFNDSSTVPGDPNYNDPCCEELGKTGNAYACPWPQRGYCTDNQCGAIPEGAPRERCGGPRHSWCNKCIDNNCPGYGKTTPTATPVVQPTTPPQPTNTPIIVPTNPVVQPTQSNVIPTSLINSTTPPVPTIPPPQTFTLPTSPPPQQTNIIQPNLPVIQLPSLPTFQFPKLNFSHLVPVVNTQKINESVAKPLGFFEYLFERVSYYDKKLENKINSNIGSLFERK